MPNTGAAMTPASPASAAPIAKGTAKSRAMATPSGAGRGPADAAPERREHRGVLHSGADQRTDTRATVHDREDDSERDTERDHEEPIDRIVATQDRDGVIQSGREWHGADLASPRQADEVGDDKGHADREQHLIEMSAAQAP